MSIRDLMADICDALNDNARCGMFVMDGVYSHPTKEVFVSVKSNSLCCFDYKQLVSIDPNACTEIQYIAYVFFVSLKKYGYDVNVVTIKSDAQWQVSSKVA